MRKSSKNRTQRKKELKSAATTKTFKLELIEHPGGLVGQTTLQVGAYMTEEVNGKVVNVQFDAESTAHNVGGWIMDMLNTYATKTEGLLNLVPINNTVETKKE